MAQKSGRWRPATAFPRRQPAGARLAAACLSAAVLILTAACSSGGTGSAGSGGSAGATLAPRQAVLAAAIQARQVTSAVETLAIQETGTTGSTATATVRLRLKPTLEASEDLHVTEPGKATRLQVIITGKALYFSAASLAAQIGKPWVKVDLSSLNGTSLASLAQLIQSLQSNDFANQTQLLTAATNTHVVGTQTVDGVPTTEYAGSFRASDGLKALPASIRKILAPELQALGNSVVSFREWIDGRHYVRKTTVVETVNGRTIRTTVNITDINQPVQITLPPASQTVTESSP